MHSTAETNVCDGVTTASPRRTPDAISAIVSASVPEPTPITQLDMDVDAAKATAALLTAAAYGPMNEWAFVAPSDGAPGRPGGLGLWARAGLQRGQLIGECGGDWASLFEKSQLPHLLAAGWHRDELDFTTAATAPPAECEYYGHDTGLVPILTKRHS